MERWFEEAEANAIPGAIMYLVGSKLDKDSTRKVSFEEGDALARLHASKFCEVSSKTRQNIRQPFVEIVEQVVSSPQLLEQSRRKGGISLEGTPFPSSSLCSC
jgi:Ras-related protein Rab-18